MVVRVGVMLLMIFLELEERQKSSGMKRKEENQGDTLMSDCVGIKKDIK
jgi:hypothetical protein